MMKLVFCLVMFLTACGLCAQDNIAWQPDGSVIVGGSEVTFTSNIVASSEDIPEDSMILVSQESYMSRITPSPFGINASGTTAGHKSHLRVMRRLADDAGIEPFFGYKVQGTFDEKNAQMIYGCKTPEGGGTLAEDNYEETWQAYGYDHHLSRRHVESDDYRRLMHRPKSQNFSGWEIAGIVAGVVLVVGAITLIVVTAGAAAGPLASGYAVVAGTSASTFVAAMTSVGGIAATLGMLGTGVACLVAVGIHHEDNPRGMMPQFSIEKNMEIPLPNKIVDPVSEEDKNFNKMIDKYLIHAEPCTDIPDLMCRKANLIDVVVQMDIKNIHVNYVNFPGSFHHNMTPYQLFEQIHFTQNMEDTLVIAGLQSNAIESVAQDAMFTTVHQKLPKHIYRGTTGDHVQVDFTSSEVGDKHTFYLASSTSPTWLGDGLFRDLGLYLTDVDGVEYNLYKFQFLSTEEEPIVSINLDLGNKGPFLVGDNLEIGEIRTTTAYPSLVINDDDYNHGLVDNTKITVHGNVLVSKPSSVPVAASENLREDFGLWVEEGIVSGDFALLDKHHWNGIPDYVFEPHYRLTSLADKEAYIRQFKHLPHVPSASEIKNENHYKVKEMVNGQLQNLEELYLHALAQEKEIQSFDCVLSANEKKLMRLEKKINKKLNQKKYRK